MVRKFKFHEQKLLKRVDFLEWKKNDNPHESLVIGRYHLQDREDYTIYMKICGMITKLANELSLLSPDNPFRQTQSAELLDKLYEMGVINDKKTLSQLEKVTVSSICRRRLAVVMKKLKMAEKVSDAAKFIEQGHVRVGPDTIKNPAMLINRKMEDFITWSHGSKIKTKIQEYNNIRDDYNLMT